MFSKKSLCRISILMVFLLFLTVATLPQAVQAVGYGDVHSFGTNGQGQLGHGDTDQRHVPTKIDGLGPVATVAASNFNYYSLIVLADGDVYSFGMNFYGQLGHGDTDNRNMPTKIIGLENARTADAGGGHSLVLLENGDVYSFGFHRGQLGQDYGVDNTRPAKIAGLGPAQTVSAGGEHSLVLLENGNVYAFGQGGFGQLGDGDRYGNRAPEKIEGLPPIKEISAGYTHSLVVTTTGEVYAFGSNGEGELGLGHTEDVLTPTRITGIDPALQVSAGNKHSLILLENGNVLSFGRNNTGQLGHGETTPQWTSVTTPTKIEGLGKAQAIAAGMEHSLVLSEQGDVYGFGRNNYGSLGWDPDLGSHPAPYYNPVPTKIEGLGEVQVISAGYNFSLVLEAVEREISITIDNSLLHPEVPPIILHGRTLVPLRAIFEALDVEVEWIAETRTVIGTTDDTRIELTVDSTRTLLNGVEGALDVPATIIEGRTLVPVRFIAESTGQNVDWDAENRRVVITTR